MDLSQCQKVQTNNAWNATCSQKPKHSFPFHRCIFNNFWLQTGFVTLNVVDVRAAKWSAVWQRSGQQWQGSEGASPVWKSKEKRLIKKERFPPAASCFGQKFRSSSPFSLKHQPHTSCFGYHDTSPHLCSALNCNNNNDGGLGRKNWQHMDVQESNVQYKMFKLKNVLSKVCRLSKPQ